MQGISLEDLRQGILTGQLKDEVPILEIDKIKLNESIYNFNNHYVNNNDFFKQINFYKGAIKNEK